LNFFLGCSFDMKNQDEGVMVKNGGIITFKKEKDGEFQFFSNFMERKKLRFLPIKR